MSTPVRPESTDRGCELAPVTCWPLIIGAASVAVLGGLIAVVLLLSDAVWPTTVPVAAAPETKKPPEPEQASPVLSSAVVEPLPVRPAPQRVVTVKRVVVREYRPMPGRNRVERKQE